MKHPSQEVTKFLQQYFKKQEDARIAGIMLCNDQITKEKLLQLGIVKITASKKNQFLKSKFSFIQPQAVIERQYDFDSLISQIKRQCLGVDSSQTPLHILGFFQQIVSEKVNQQKSRIMGQKFQISAICHRELMKELLENALEIFDLNDESFIEQIVDNPDLNFFVTVSELKDTTIRKKVSKFINSFSSFAQLKLYNGKDIQSQKLKIYNILMSELPFSIEKNQEIIAQIMKNQISNIMANREDISIEQKRKFFASKLYQNKILETYSHLKEYPKSIAFQLRSDVAKILEFIEDIYKVNVNIFNDVNSFNLKNLFVNDQFTPAFLSKLNNFIKENCQNYYQAYLKVKHLKRNPKSFAQNSKITKSFEIKAFFKKIGVCYEEWDRLERCIFEKDYAQIDTSLLNNQNKYKLWNFIIGNMYQYYDENRLQFVHEVQEELQSALINSDCSLPFKTYTLIIEELLQSFSSEILKQLGPSDQNKLNKAIQTCCQYKQFQNNNKVGQKEFREKLRRQLLATILKINYENNIQVPYQTIIEFIGAYLQAPNQATFNSYDKYVCSPRQFIGFIRSQKPKQMNQSEKKQEPKKIQQAKKQSKDPRKLLEDKNILIINFIKLFENNPGLKDGSIGKIFDKLQEDQQKEFAENLLRTNPFETNEKLEGKSYLKSMQINAIQKQASKQEIKKQVKPFVERYKELIQQLDGSSNSSNSPQKISAKEEIKQSKEILQNTKLKLIEQFNNTYTQLFPQSSYVKLLEGKFADNKPEIAEKLLSINFYENPLSNIEGITKMQNNKLKQQCQKTKDAFSELIVKFKSVQNKLSN